MIHNLNRCTTSSKYLENSEQNYNLYTLYKKIEDLCLTAGTTDEVRAIHRALDEIVFLITQRIYDAPERPMLHIIRELDSIQDIKKKLKLLKENKLIDYQVEAREEFTPVSISFNEKEILDFIIQNS